MIDVDGNVHPFLTDIPSTLEEGRAGSVHHLLIDGGTLWAVLGTTSDVAISQLLKLDISNFKGGDASIKMSDDHVAADIATFVINYPFINPTQESNVHHLAAGPSGVIYIVDAAANALLAYNKNTGALNVITEFLPFNNTTSLGPPRVDVVPTGVVYHDGDIFVSVFGGFPFNSSDSRIFKVGLDGQISTTARGFNGAVDLMSDGQDLLVVEFAKFNGSFQANTSTISRLKDSEREVIVDGLNFVGGVCQNLSGDFFVTSMGTGEVLKISRL